MLEHEPTNELKKYQDWKAPESSMGVEGNRKLKIEKLFGHCFEMSKLEDNDRLPVGGRSVFSNEADAQITCDFNAMEKFFQAIHGFASSLDKEELKKYLERNKIELDEELFIPLFAITKALEKKLPPPKTDDEGRERVKKREELVFKKESVKLNELVNEKSVECAEIAALAQYALQNEKIDSSYFSGEIMRNKEWEGSDPHSFIPIHFKNKIYIYDPANPIETTGGLFPNINTTEADFDAEVKKGKQQFVTAKNIVTQKETYYGVNAVNGGVSKEDIV